MLGSCLTASAGQVAAASGATDGNEPVMARDAGTGLYHGSLGEPRREEVGGYSHDKLTLT